MAKLNVVRSFYPTPLPESLVDEIISDGYNSILNCVVAGYGRFPPLDYLVYYKLTGAEKEKLISALRRGYARERAQPSLPLISGWVEKNTGLTELEAAEEQLSLLEQAPVLIFLANQFDLKFDYPIGKTEHIFDLQGVQCVALAAGAMCLRAAELGLGCLLSTYTYLAQEELRQISTAGGPVALLALGYANETEDSIVLRKKPQS